MSENVVQGILSFLSGGVVLAFIEWIRYKRKDTADAREKDILNGNAVYGHWKIAYDDAKGLYKEMKEQNEKLELAMDELKQKFDEVHDKYTAALRENKELKAELLLKDRVIANFEERLKKLEQG